MKLKDKQSRFDLSRDFSAWVTGGSLGRVKAEFDARFSHDYDGTNDFAGSIIDPIDKTFDWSFVDSEGFVAAIGDAVSGAAILIPTPAARGGFQAIASFNYDPAGVGETGRLLIGVMDAHGNVNYYIEIEDDQAGASQLVATAYTNNGDNTFAAGTPTAPQASGLFSVTVATLNGARKLYFNALSTYLSGSPDDGLRFAEDYVFVVVSNTGLAGSYWTMYLTEFALKAFGFKVGLP